MTLSTYHRLLQDKPQNKKLRNHNPPTLNGQREKLTDTADTPAAQVQVPNDQRGLNYPSPYEET